MTDARAYRSILTEQQYGTIDNLAARQAIYRWADSPVDATEWALDRVIWSGVDRLVDVGCGSGRYLPLARERGASSVVGCDVSAGMLVGIDRADGHQLVQADAQSLPLATGSADIALAMHMLYHVPSVVTAVRELRRVVRPDGTLLAMTNGCDHQAELQSLASDAMSAAVAGRVIERPSLIAGFTFENGGAQLAAAFTRVEAHELRGAIAVPEVAPLVAYIDSQRAPLAWLLPDVDMWPAVLAEAGRIAAEVVGREGVFRSQTHVGVFACH